MELKGAGNMTYAIIRVRGNVDVRKTIKDTLNMLRLNRVNHCVIIPESPEYLGMIKKVKDYVTWGEIEEDMLTKLLTTRGKLIGDVAVTDKYVKSNSQFNSPLSMSSLRCSSNTCHDVIGSERLNFILIESLTR